MDIKALRKEYQNKPLDKNDLDDDPFKQFQKWFQDTIKAGIEESNAMSLATSTSDGKPSCRTVLMKGFNHHGLLFFTNYGSRKARELHKNPFAAVTFFWRELERQVCIEGKVEKISEDLSKEYFLTRPRKSQIAAWCSKQSSVAHSREAIETEFYRLEKLYEGQDIPLPPFWGGFRLIPHRFEFWHGRRDRLHDRFSYVLKEGAWHIERLYP